MAELILTPEEENAGTWLELDDATIGKVVKATQLSIFNSGNDQGRIYWFSAALLLCCLVADTNAEKFTQELKNITTYGKSIGDWKITIKRIKAAGE
jgi:hypothetical protein